MLDDYEKDIEKLYKELRDKIVEENSYLKREKEIDDKIISEIVMDKRVITDKIEKKSEPERLSNVAKLRIQSIIREMLKLEEENEDIYETKLQSLDKEISNIINQKKLKNKYSTGNSESIFIDKKK